MMFKMCASGMKMKALAVLMMVAVITLPPLVSAVHKVDLADLESRVMFNNIIAKRATFTDLEDPASQLYLGENVGFELRESMPSAQGETMNRYRETYNGIKIFNTLLLLDLEQQSGGISHVITADLYTDFEGDLAGQEHCQVDQDQAEAIAVNDLDVEVGSVERVGTEEWIYVDRNNVVHYAWAVDVSTILKDGEVSRSQVLIDQCTGQVLESFRRSTSFVRHERSNSSDSEDASFISQPESLGESGHEPSGQPVDACEIKQRGGNPKRPFQYGTPGFCLRLTKSEDGETCYLENEYVKGVHLHGETADDKVNKTEVFSFPCAEGYHDEINGGYSPMFDTFFFATKTMEMFEDWYEYRVLTDPVPYVKAHYSFNVFGAYFDNNAMMVGDGIEDVFYPLAVIDVVGHEMTHGVTDVNSNLLSEGQSGALNEAFSDMAGEVAEEYVFGESDWLTGGDFMTMEGGALRYFDDPTVNGFSIKNMANLTEQTGQHSMAGIMTHSFWQLAYVRGFGLRAAFECFLNANRLYWRETITFEEAACGTIRGAYDGGYDMDAVADSFRAVGMTLVNCSTLSELVTAELTPGVEHFGLRVSRLRNPLFKLNIPADVSTVTVTASDNIQVTISRSYQRSAPSLATGQGSVSVKNIEEDDFFIRFSLGAQAEEGEEIRNGSATVTLA